MARRRELVVLGFAALVVAASVLPGGDASGAVGVAGADKVVHAVGYAVLAALTCWSRNADTRRELVAVAVGVTLFGLGVELLQAPLPTRHASGLDALANGVGALLGVVWWRYRSRDDD